MLRYMELLIPVFKIDLNGEFDPQAPEQITVDWASNLLYYDGRLYFINQADTSRLYSMKLDGSDRAVSAGRATSAFMFYEGNLYYANVYGVYRCKPDGSNLSQLSEIRSSTLNIANGYIYHCFYADSSSTYDQSLYRMELNGSHEPMLTSDSEVISVVWMDLSISETYIRDRKFIASMKKTQFLRMFSNYMV